MLSGNYESRNASGNKGKDHQVARDRKKNVTEIPCLNNAGKRRATFFYRIVGQKKN